MLVHAATVLPWTGSVRCGSLGSGVTRCPRATETKANNSETFIALFGGAMAVALNRST
jgi:hypothetical protein